MRIAAIVYLAPRKLGSLEQWVMEFAAEARRRGHALQLFCGRPVHPTVQQTLRDLGVGWTPYQELERHPFRWGRELRRSYDLIYTNLVVPQSRLAYAAYLAWPLPICFFDAISGQVPGQRPRRWIWRTIDPLVFSRVKFLGACSNYVLQRDLQRFHRNGAAGEVFYNGVDTNRFVPPAGARPDPERIVAVANLIPEKGIAVLLKACALVRELPWRLVIVGDGPELPRLTALAGSLDIAERTEFLGLRDDVDAVLRDSAIYAHPCLWEEAFGLTIAEAMASGCAVVASRVGGIPEIIEDGSSGLLVERGDVQALALELRQLLIGPERRARLAAQARRAAVERFGLRRAVDSQVSWIERSLGGEKLQADLNR